MRFKILNLIILFLLSVRCGFSQMTVLRGKGEAGIAGYYNEWVIRILNNDSIEMLCSMKKDSLDTRAMNRQYYGHLTPSENYDYKVVIDKALHVDDCNKPRNEYLGTDTIPFHIDSLLFNETRYWDLEIKNFNKGDTLIRITNTFYAYYATENKEINMVLYPELKSGYLPISIETRKKCAVDIGTHLPFVDYYINKTKNGYVLIGDITPYANMQNKKCPYCIKITMLR